MSQEMSRQRLEGLAAHLERELRDAGTPERAVNEKRYLKSDLEHFGVPVPVVRKLARRSVRGLGLDRGAVLALADVLWANPVHERRLAAVEVLIHHAGLLEAEDLAVVETLIRQGSTWALVDPLAVKLAGSLVERFPELGRGLDRWASDGDFWVRRSALLALLLPLRRGDGDLERFSRTADGMLEEREFFVRKAIGWVLREIAKKRPEWVAAWLAPRAARASGVTLREAVKYLPAAERQALMAAYRARG